MSILEQIHPCDNDKPYIFISYSSWDKELVWQDVLDFQEDGYNVWLDEHNLDRTNASWQDDVMKAIENYRCQLLVFYLSPHSLISEACYKELKHTSAPETVSFHGREPVNYIVIETEPVEKLNEYEQRVYERLINRKDLSDSEKQTKVKMMQNFIDDIFKSSNEKTRYRSKNDPRRNLDYRKQITAVFPENTRLYTPASTNPAQILELSTEEIDTKAWEYYKKEAYNEGISFLTPYAEQGNAHAQFWVALFYSNSKADPNSPQRQEYDKLALEWYQKSANQGYASAQMNLGFCYQYHLGTAEDPELAVYWYRKAADQGSETALNALGMCYLTGYGPIPKDREEARRLLTSAAQKGLTAAHNNLCRYFPD